MAFCSSSWFEIRNQFFDRWTDNEVRMIVLVSRRTSSFCGCGKNPNMQPTVREEVGGWFFLHWCVSKPQVNTYSRSEVSGYRGLIRIELQLTLGCLRLGLRARILCPICFAPSMWSLLHLAKWAKVISMQKEPPKLFRGSTITDRSFCRYEILFRKLTCSVLGLAPYPSTYI